MQERTCSVCFAFRPPPLPTGVPSRTALADRAWLLWHSALSDASRSGRNALKPMVAFALAVLRQRSQWVVLGRWHMEGSKYRT